MITDAQVHLFQPNTPEHPWPADPGRGAPKVPSYTAEQMVAAMDETGVDRAVIVPPVWAGDDNDYAFAACSAYPGRFAVMGRIDPFSPGTPRRLEGWLKQPNMLGIRMSSKWATRDETFPQLLDNGDLDWFFASCARLGIPVMCLTREALSAIGPIAKAHPDLRLIIDHMATVDASTVKEAFIHIESLLSLARYGNVSVKVSTAPNYSQEEYPFADVHPILKRIYDLYGSRRMLWAADITQLTKNTYTECLRLWQEGLPFLTGSDRDRILGGTVAELLKWREPA